MMKWIVLFIFKVERNIMKKISLNVFDIFSFLPRNNRFSTLFTYHTM